MKIIHFILILLILGFSFETSAKKKKPYPHAEIKVGYTYHNSFVRGSDGIVKKDISFVLLANKEHSKFFSSDTESKDSLQSTPKGRAIHKQIFDDAVRRYSETKDESAMSAVVHHTNLYVFRSIPENKMTVYDYVGGLDYAYCNEPLGEIKWEIADSTKNVLGYECIMASANYHGRDWTAWFTPEIPISEGPWKLTGLPGLILEATESTGQHSFFANGLETSDQEITPIYPYRQYEKNVEDRNVETVIQLSKPWKFNKLSTYRHRFRSRPY